MLAIASASFPYPQFVWFSEKVFYSEESAFGYPMKMANNLLAVVLERENDIACEIFLSTFFRRFHFD
jgi:hypothetical protein